MNAQFKKVSSKPLCDITTVRVKDLAKLIAPMDTFTHPEQKENEVFLLNVKDEEDWESNLPNFIESVRRGNTAYSRTLNPIPGLRPLFGIMKKKK